MRNRHQLSQITGIPEEEILNAYAYGSEVYGTWREGSDEDFIIVRSGEYETTDVRSGDIDVTIYDISHFQAKLDAHYISMMECMWLSIIHKYEDHLFSFELDLKKLRPSISECCSISFCKARKRLDPNNNLHDPYSAKKSMWHSIRMAEYGRQIAVYGFITDYEAVNHLRKKILALPNDWPSVKKACQPVYNHYMSEFKKVAPKG